MREHPRGASSGSARSDRRERPGRIVAVDVVRAVALFGVLVENVGHDFRVSAFDRFVSRGESEGLSGLDLHAARLATGVFEEHSLVLFSLLFGMGLAEQQIRASAGGTSFGGLATRRALFLLVLGIAHFVLLWSGDILALYALAALVVVQVLRLRLAPRWLGAIAAAMWVVHVLPLGYPRPFESEEAMRLHVEMTRAVLGQGSYPAIVAFRVAESRPAWAVLVWMLPRTIALVLAGAAAWRVGRANAARAERLLPAIALGGIALGAAALAARESLHGAWAGRWVGAVEALAHVLLGVGGGATIAVATELPVIGALLRSLAPLGAMTLTCYLVQSLVLGFVFYGYGLGLHGRVGPAAGLGIAAVLFSVQAVAAAWWLRRYRFGPLEWAWRAWSHRERAR